MALLDSPVNQDGESVHSISTVAGTAYLPEAIVPRAGALDTPIASQRVATHADDAAFVPGTDGVVVIAGQADETATDSVDEGDAAALRVTLNRRLIDASHYKDDTAFTAADYVAAIGAVADETTPDSVDEGDFGALRMTLTRALHTASVADAAAITSVASQDTNITILAANVLRTGAIIFNNDTGILFIKFGATATATTSNTASIAAGATYTLPSPVYRGIIDGIWTTSGSGSANVTELT